ncbi:MAG: tRNA preQ1(34) S-adenosylmethionine ribosyltransferase-isomerase QueA [Planctomycetes bacterium]|nr:tRNA preQ1(34) S-adenosylmethionine ribosyltransferase-isomerase QueA [Planctomycetota bacterium]
MKLRDFDYFLPAELVAQTPAPRRDGARLMVAGPQGIEHRRFSDLGTYLRAGDLLVLNDTKVLPARLSLRRETGGRVEALLVRQVEARRWEALLKTSRRLGVGERLRVEERFWSRIIDRRPTGRWMLEFDRPLDGDLDRLGRAPLPPYIRRAPTTLDRERYQTVYAERPGSIAAPTAGLHFTEDLLKRVRRAGVSIARLTLHVGTGTFLPVYVEDVEDHRMEAEWYDIPEETAVAVRRAHEEGGRVVAVGTTSCRTLETWARTKATRGWTDLFIRPPFQFREVDALITNFHLPKSTLLMLVCAFAGRECVLRAYAEAVQRRYRFFSYGDAMLLQ